MPSDASIELFITICSVLGAVILFVVFIFPLHPRLPGWAAWQEVREADRRATLLLRAVLGEPSYQEFVRKGHIEVPSRLYPGRAYLIKQWPEKVEVVEKGRTVAVLCAEPESDVPPADLIVIHKLMIEDNEQEFLRIANKIP